ncbi:MAG: cysteine desulfurase family protein [Xanthobacteraceae bacterium]|uniref:cysteine desulfurase family protein n=1 Tax=Pseudolabrys sp. TaxID=1960880 RepID=UPI003D0C11E7
MSTPRRSYFDWNATAPLRGEARAAMQAALATTGNASSVHAEGRAARALIEQARADVAALVGAEAKQVIFTAGGTEANALALTPQLEAGSDKTPRGALLVSAVEHPSVLAGGRFAQVEIVPVDAQGRVDPVQLQKKVEQTERPLVSVMFANNETGIIQPIADMGAIVHAAGGLLHVDAVQGAGRVACDMVALGADLMTVSGHKIGGPQGVGALVRRADLHLPALIRGGGQERGYRAGTENVAAIAGFGAAARAALAEREAAASRMAGLRDRIEAGLRAENPDVVIFGAGAERLPNTISFSKPGMKAETAIIAFDLNGIAVSSGAACSSGKVQPSHVLAAMGVDPALAGGAIRLSLGWETTEDDAGNVLNAWRKVASALSKGRGIAA